MGLILTLRKLSIKSLLTHHVLEPILRVGWNLWDLIFPPQKLSENFGI